MATPYAPSARCACVVTLALLTVVTVLPPVPICAQAAPVHATSGSHTVTLRDVLDSVRLRSPLLEAARARARAVGGTRTAAGTFENPMLSYQVENAPFPGGRPLAGAATEHLTMASLPLAPLYQRSARLAQADASVRAADADARATSQRVALDAARAYYRAAMAEVGADAANNLTRWLDTVVTYNRTRVQQGVTAEADLIRSELERDRALADAGVQAAELARSRVDLSAFLGDPVIVGTMWRVAVDEMPLAWPNLPTVARVAATKAPAQGMMLSAAEVDQRPDVTAARERLAAATAAASLEQRMRLRELGAMLGVKQTAGVSSMLVGVSVPLPLLDQNRGAVASAGALREAAGYELLAQQRTARAELLGAEEVARILTERVNAMTARDSMSGAVRYLTRADESRAIALGAYREGAVPLMQVLDAARAWGDARLSFYRALYAQHDAVLALIVARGEDVATVFLPVTKPTSSIDRSPH